MGLFVAPFWPSGLEMNRPRCSSAASENSLPMEEARKPLPTDILLQTQTLKEHALHDRTPPGMPARRPFEQATCFTCPPVTRGVRRRTPSFSKFLRRTSTRRSSTWLIATWRHNCPPGVSRPWREVFGEFALFPGTKRSGAPPHRPTGAGLWPSHRPRGAVLTAGLPPSDCSVGDYWAVHGPPGVHVSGDMASPRAAGSTGRRKSCRPEIHCPEGQGPGFVAPGCLPRGER